MRLSLNVIGLTTALLLGGSALTANPLPIETIAIGGSSQPMFDVVSAPVAGAKDAGSVLEASSETTAATKDVQTSSPAQELRENLYEVGKALKEGALAAAQVISGVCNLVMPVANVVVGTVMLGLSLVKLVWFTGKVAYTTGSVVVGGFLSLKSYLTK